MLNLIWRQSARHELRAIIDYISDRNGSAAERLETAIHHCAERLPQFPYLYRPGRVPGTREAVVHPNYVLVYRVMADTVEILSVIHARREYP